MQTFGEIAGIKQNTNAKSRKPIRIAMEGQQTVLRRVITSGKKPKERIGRETFKKKKSDNHVCVD